jgi:hypothetical protein
MSRSEFKRRISGLIKEGHGSGVRALLLRWEAFSRPFFKKETKFSPATLFGNTLWLKPNRMSEFDFLVVLLRHMGEGAEVLSHLGDMHYIEQKRYAETQAKLMGIFQSVRLTMPFEAVAAAFSKRRSFVVAADS